MGYGTDTALGITFQNSFGTPAVVDSMMYIPFVSENVSLKIPDLLPDAKIGRFDEPESEGGPRTVDGDISFEPRPIELGQMLKAVMGAADSVVNSDAIYLHSFTPRVTDWDDVSANVPVTMYKDMSAGANPLFHHDLVGSVLELSVANGELLKGRVGFVGGTNGISTVQADSYHGGRYFTWDTASVDIAGTAIADIDQLTLTLDEGLEPGHTLNGSKYPSRVKRAGSKRTVSISGTIKFDDLDEYNEFITQSYRELDVTFTGPTEIQSGYYDTLRIQCPRMKYTDFAPVVEGDGEINVSFSAKAKYSQTSGTSLKISLTNTFAAY